MKTLMAINRKRNTVEIIRGVCWEQLQGMARVGIQMADGAVADGIGRTEMSEAEFVPHARKLGATVLGEPAERPVYMHGEFMPVAY